MKPKTWIRIFVLAAVIGWPAYESYQLHVARQQLAASIEVHESVSAKLAQARIKFAQASLPGESTLR